MSQVERKPVEIGVPAEDPKNGKAKPNEKKGKEVEQKLSEEDARIKEQVELLVTRAGDVNAGLAKIAVEQLVDLLCTSGSGSVASVPKPLKYVRSLYPDLEQALQSSTDAALTKRLHDVLSFVAMTLVFDDGRRATLEHKLKGTTDDLAKWGHEYQRFLAGSVAEEWKERVSKNMPVTQLSDLVRQIVQYMIAHQDEPAAIDLLLEIDDVARLLPLVDESNYKRIANYLAATAKYLTRPSDTEVLGIVVQIYAKVHAYADAVTIALRLNDRVKIEQLFAQCESKAMRLQMALTCARCFFFLDFDDEEQDELLQEANGNMRVSQLYRQCAESLDALAPRTPEEIFKTDDGASRLSKDARYNLACAFVSGLANCGYGKDKYLTGSDTLFFDQKESHILTSTATLGLLHLWDHSEGLQAIDRYFYSESNYIKAGACLASGIVMCGVKNPFDPALGLLAENVTAPQREVALGAILGLGYAYAGTRKEEVKELLVPILADGTQVLETQCMAAYALAMVYVGSADSDITETMMNCLLEVPKESLLQTAVHYLILALGCMFLGCQEAADTLVDATRVLPPSIRRYTEIVITSCAFAATGNVLIVQKLFHAIAENDEEDEEGTGTGEEGEEGTTTTITATKNATAGTAPTTGENTAATLTATEGTASTVRGLEPGADASVLAAATEAATESAAKTSKEMPLNYKAAAVLGIGLVAVGEELGEEMAKRAIIHVLLADTVSKGALPMSGRRAVPLVYALLSASNPNMTVVETLNRLAHDSDAVTATNAILALGLVSAGSNNARVANKLKSLASYYQKDKYASTLFVVRLAQGLCAMGKGHLTLSPLQNDRGYTCMTSVMGLLGVLHSAIYLEQTLLDKYDYMLFSIVPNIRPRMVLAVDETMTPVDGVQVRVGLPVDTVALPGRPKSITGFQTQTTPVLLSATDKVEVADTKYKPVPSSIEGIFVVEPRPQVE